MDLKQLLQEKRMTARRSSSVCLCALAILVGWSCIFFALHPLKKDSSLLQTCTLSSKFNSDGEVVIPVPIRLIMTGEPIAIEQDDRVIIDYIWKNNFLERPSTKPYNLKAPKEDPSKGQAWFIRKILANMENGFFVECGGLDGETRSNTLYLEQHLKWKGVVIEGDPKNYALMQAKNRKAWISNTCLAVKPYPHQANFMQSFNVGKILESNSSTRKEKATVVKVQCFPLFSLLTALNVTTVDYFSLDVEGSELKVLKTIPFDKVKIKTLSVEFVHIAEGKDALIAFMKSKGYKNVGEVRYPGGLADDVMFAHESVTLSTTGDA